MRDHFSKLRAAIEERDFEAAGLLVDEIEASVNDAGWLWPPGVMDQAVAVFGPQAQNIHGRTYKALNRRVAHAVAVWGRRYNGLDSEALWKYAGDVLSYSIKHAAKKARQPSLKYPYVYRELESIVHNDKVLSGFRRRMPNTNVSVTDILQEV